jgi:hypothetical protein
MIVGAAETFARELCLAALAQGAQPATNGLELLSSRTVGLGSRLGLQLTEFVQQLRIDDEVVFGRHREAGGSLSLSRFHPNSAATSSAET